MDKIKDFLLNEIVSPGEWAEFEKLVKSYDWYHFMSDDTRVAQKGRQQQDRINAFKKKLTGEDREKADYIYLKEMTKNGVGKTPEAERYWQELKKKFN
jgi:hypothetical protein